MAEPSLAFAITPEYFSCDPLPWERFESRLDAAGAPPATVAVVIALLDDLEGDCDFELNGDERDGDCQSDEATVPF